MPWIDPADGPLDLLFPGEFLSHWKSLADNADLADPFCCAPIWNLSYHGIFTPYRRIFYESSPRGAIIFGEYPTPRGDTIYAPMEESWLFGQPLLGHDSIALFRECLPVLLNKDKRSLTAFCISGVVERSLFAARLLHTFGEEYAFFSHSFFIQASASLENGLDGWLSHRSANHRAKLRKASRKAQASGIDFIRVQPDQKTAPAIYERMLAIEERSWKGISHNGMSDSPSREFYGAMIRRLAGENGALVMFATQDGKDLGFIFGGLLDRYYRGQQFSYIKDASSYSIGNLLQFEQVKWLCELGIERYDMGTCSGPRMGYKSHWTEQFCEAQTWIMRRKI